MNVPKKIVASVIVTSFNQEATIHQTLLSILQQKCDFVFEVIIADDCSIDKTQKIAEEYQSKFPDVIKLDFRNENLGVGSNWALSVKGAQGKYIFTCAADDYWHQVDKLQIQVAYMEQHLSCGLLYTDYNVIDSNKNKIIQSYLTSTLQQCPQGSGLMTQIFAGKVPILTLTTCFRKELFDMYIPVEDYVKYRFPLEDWPTWIILSKYCKIGYLPFSSATYRRGHESLSNISDYDKTEKRFKAEHKVYQYICRMFPDDLIYNESGYLVYTDTIMLSLAYKKNDYFKAKEYAKKLHLKGFRNNKTIFATNWVLFKIFNLLKSLKQNFS